MSVRRASGTPDIQKFPKASGSAIAELELVKKNGTSNNVTPATAGAAILGIAVQSGASASTDEIDVDVLKPGDKIIIDVGSGTPASGDCKSCDLADSKNAAVGTDAQHDLLYKYHGSTTEVIAYPKRLEVATVIS